MAKVDFPEGNTPFFNPSVYANVKSEARKPKDKASVKGSKKVPFTSFLHEAESSESAELSALPDLPVSEETLQILLDDIHAAGDDLKAKPFPDQIKKYKSAVRNFLHYVVENSYTAEERISGINILKRKKFTLIQVVDKKLEQLAAGILAGQTTQLELLSRLDEIAGLLVNLLQ